MTKSEIKSNIFKILLACIVLPVMLLGICIAAYPQVTWNEIPFHSVLESVGLFAGISLAIILLMQTKRREGISYYLWISSALIGMGILDGFHASVNPGNPFIWLHSLALFVGGILFALVWLSIPVNDNNRINLFIPLAVGIGCIFLGIVSLFYHDILPLMSSGGGFTSFAILLNLIGGIFFILASLKFLYNYWMNNRNEELYFGSFCLLNGIAGLSFSYSFAWDAGWWLWHILRVSAYVLLFYYLFVIFQRSEIEIHETKLNLEKKEELEEITQEIQDAVGILSLSSSEILSITTQIAAGAAETASAVNETTTTIEEVKQTSDLSSEKAKLVADNAQNTSKVAQSGEKAVEEVIESMQQVQEQMEVIAENVVQLAEKNQEIGELIVIVNDIAEQSNILAVNASIEAAMAGEEGKGFEVVAREIRMLADQSKQATAKVRSILSDIQRGVSAAVMASEQGNRTVNESMKKSGEAGESIRDLTKTIGESAKAAILIAASSQQQTVGITQIVQSMENIKLASQQNLESTKQAEETAKSLHVLGQKLSQLTDRYHH